MLCSKLSDEPSPKPGRKTRHPTFVSSWLRWDLCLLRQQPLIHQVYESPNPSQRRIAIPRRPFQSPPLCLALEKNVVSFCFPLNPANKGLPSRKHPPTFWTLTATGRAVAPSKRFELRSVGLVQGVALWPRHGALDLAGKHRHLQAGTFPNWKSFWGSLFREPRLSGLA